MKSAVETDRNGNYVDDKACVLHDIQRQTAGIRTGFRLLASKLTLYRQTEMKVIRADGNVSVLGNALGL